MRRLTSFFLYYTWDCNLQCQHCWVYGGESHDGCLGKEKAISSCIEAAELGARFIKITGGEPLLYFKDVIEIVNTVKHKYQSMMFCLETNATLITPENVADLKCFDSISVSVDSAIPEVHDEIRGVIGSFRKTCNAIRYLRQNGIAVSITTTVRSVGKIDQIDRVVDLACQLGCQRIKLNPIMNIGRAQKADESFYSITPLQMIELQNRYSGLSEIDVCIMLPCAYNVNIYAPEKSRLHSCDCLSLLSLLPDGTVGLCGEARYLSGFTFGDYHNETLHQIWEKSNNLTRLRNIIPYGLTGVCGKCAIRDICKGGCRVEGVVSGGSLESPSYICQYMYNKGLFHFAK